MNKAVKFLLVLLLLMIGTFVLCSCATRAKTPNLSENAVSVTYYDENGEILKSEKLTAPEVYVPEKEGKVFVGWYLDSEYTEVFTSAVSGNVALYAKWEDKKFSVTFKNSDGSIIPVNGADTQSVIYGHAAVAPENPVSSNGVFSGWDKAFNSVKSNLIITAEYSELISKLTFYLGDQIVCSYDEVKSGKDLTAYFNSAGEAVYDFVPIGFDFEGWYSDSDDSTSIDGGVMPATDTAYYAELKLLPLAQADLSIVAAPVTRIENEYVYSAQNAVKLSATPKDAPNGIDYSYCWKLGDNTLDCVDSELTVTAPDVGNYEYRVTVTATADGYESVSATKSVSFRVTSAEIDGVSCAAVTAVYDGAPHDVFVAGTVATDEIYYKLDGGEYSITTPELKNVGDYEVFYKVVRANYSDLIGSVSVTIGKAPVALTVNDAETTYGGAFPIFTYTASGLVGGDTANVFKNKAEYAHSANTLTIGTSDITLSGLSADNYEITYMPGTLTIVKAPLTVTATDKIAVYGDAIPIYEAKFDGFVNGENEIMLSGSLEFDCAYTQGSNCGNYDITVSGLGSDNYSITYTDGTLTVGKKGLTVTADNKTAIYGDAAPEYSAQISGLYGTDAFTPKYSCTYSQGSNAGVYEITASGIVTDNYEVSYVNGTLTVGKKDLTVTADNKKVTYGDAVPVYTAQLVGLYGTDDFAPEYTCIYTQGSDAGSYNITVSGIVTDNYEVSYVNGTLTVVKKDLTVTADNKKATYGDAAPVYTAQLVGLYGSDDFTPELTCTYSQGANAVSYEIIPSGIVADNYKISYVKGTLTVSKKALTVTADNKTITYGDAAPVYTAQLVGLYGTDDFVIEYSCTYVQGSKAGSYNITVSGIVTDNYEIAYTNGTLTVGKKDLTVTADSKTATYGDVAPVYTAQLVGLYGLDTFTPDLACAYVQGSNADSYDIIASGIVTDNYSVTYINGTLTVSTKAVTVIINEMVASDGNTPWTKSDWNGVSGLASGDVLSGILSTSSGAAGIYSASSTLSSDFTWTDMKIQGSGIDKTSNYSFNYSLHVEIVIDEFDYSASGYSGKYDGGAHGISVSTSLESAEITYSENGIDFTSVKPTYTYIGSHTVYFCITDTNEILTAVSGSKTVVIEKADLTVTADDKAVTYGDASPTYTATFDGFAASEGESVLTGTLAYSCIYSQGSGVGNYVITVSGLSSDNYEISYVNGTLTVGKKSLTVTAANKTATYGDAAPIYTAQFSGLYGSDTFTPVMSCTYTKGANAGNYDITVNTIATNNYSVTYVNGMLVVGKKALTVTAANKTATYGDAAPIYTAQFSGLYGSDTFTPVMSCTYTKGANAGNYDITVNTIATNNYTVAYVNGTLAVGKKALTVTADNKTVTYGDPIPTYTAKFVGLYGSDAFTPNYGCTYAQGSDAGSYDITVSGIVTVNYSVSYVKGSLTVDKKALTVTADSITVYYGDAVPNYTAKYSGLYAGDSLSPSFACSYTQGSDVGTYDVTVSGIVTNNYSVSYVNSLLTTSPRSVAVVWSGTTGNKYDGTDQTAKVTAKYLSTSGSYVNATVLLSGQGTTFKNAGSYQATASTSDGNYSLTNVSAALTMAKGDYTNITHRSFTGVYSPSQSLSDFVLDANFIWVSSGTPTCDVTQYDAKYNADIANYNYFSLKISIVLEKASVSLSTTVFEFDYDGSAKQITPAINYNGGTLSSSNYTLSYSANSFTTAGTHASTVSLTSTNYKMTATVCYVKIKGVLVGSTYYTIEDALNTASSGTVIIANNTSFASGAAAGSYSGSGYYTVKSGVELLVPYDSAYTTTQNGVNSTATALGSVFRKLTVPSGVTITVNGTLNVNAVRSHQSTIYMGHTGGAYGQLQLDAGSVVEVNSGAVVNSMGYITGTGVMNARSGATVYDVMAIKDWRGGKISNSIKSDYFPFNQYAIANIEAYLNVYYGATLNGRYYVTTSVASPNEVMAIVGSDGMFELSSGYFTKYVDTSTGKVNLTLHGVMTTNSVTVKVGGTFTSISINTASLHLPICGYYNLVIASGSSATINTMMKLMPGASLIVEQNATLTISSSGKVYLFDNADTTASGGTAFQNGISQGAAGPAYGGTSSAGNTRLKKQVYQLTSATSLIVNGTLNIAGSFGGKIETSGTTGVINITGTTSLTAKENLNVTKVSTLSATCSYTSVTFTAIGKQNGASTATALAKGTYVASADGNNTWCSA